MTDSKSQLFNSDDLNDSSRKILSGETEPQNEYDLHLLLMWEYYQAFKQQRGEGVNLPDFLEKKELQEEAFDIWNEHGLNLAFQGLVADQRPGDGGEKMRPTDGTVSETDVPNFLPVITLDDVLKRRAEIQA